MADARLDAQICFLLEIDKLKSIVRQSLLLDTSRRENDAEHSWHLAMTALVLAEYAPAGVDLARVIRMILIHDLVEIDAGDTYCYDPEAVATQAQRERLAAQRIFSLLPDDQAVELRTLWEEFEARRTSDAMFAAALDRVQPVLLNYHTQGQAWRERRVHRDQVIARCQNINDASPRLWQYILGLIDDAAAKGWLLP